MKIILGKTETLSRILTCLFVTSVVVMFVFAGCKKDKKGENGNVNVNENGDPDCGNGIIEEGEECDGDALGGMTCADIDGFVGGTLSCTDTCTFDTTECEPEEIEPDEKAKVTILQTSDLHHHGSGYGPFADYTPLDITDNDIITGGFARIAGKINEIRAEQADEDIPVLVFDSADYFMGTIYDLTVDDPISFKFFQMMGYDAVTIGNHEWDWGPGGYAMLLNNAVDDGGFTVPVVATNMITDPDHPGDDDIETLIANGVITDKLIFDLPNGLKIGILGNLGPGAHDLTVMHVPLDFTHSPAFWQQKVDDLRENDGVDLVVIMSHGGIYEDGTGDDADMATDVNGIDVIMSGHYHSFTETAFNINNTLIYIPEEYGKWLSRLDLTYNLTQGEIEDWEVEMIAMDDTVMGDPMIHGMVEAYHAALDEQLMPVLGLGVASPIVEVPFDLGSPLRATFVEMPLGAITSDALRFTATAVALQTEGDGYVPYTLGVVPYGTIRVGLYEGSRGYATFADIFNVLPMGISPDSDNQNVPGWPLVSAYLTGAEIKNIAEVPVTVSPTFRLISAFLGLSGIRVEYDSTGGTMPPDRVRKVYLCGDAMTDPYSINCTVELDTDPSNPTLYRVVADLYTIMLMRVIDQAQMDIHPKHADGEVIDLTDLDDVLSARIDMRPDLPGVQEIKVWAALLTFVTSAAFPDTDEGRYPGMGEIPPFYDPDALFQWRLVDIAE